MATHGVKESDFRFWLSNKMKAAGWFRNSIENCTRAGLPDMYVVANGVAFWLELKCGIIDQPLIRKEQRVWGMQHHNAGGRSYFLYYNIAENNLYVYANPVINVAVRGKYLAVHDFHIAVFPYDNVIEGLLGILNN